MQQYLGSMEGAVLSGKLAAQAITIANPSSTATIPLKSSTQAVPA